MKIDRNDPFAHLRAMRGQAAGPSRSQPRHDVPPALATRRTDGGNAAADEILPKRPRPAMLPTTWAPQPRSLLLSTIPEIRNQILAEAVRDDRDTLALTLTCRQLLCERLPDRDGAVERERTRNVTVNYITEKRAQVRRTAELDAASTHDDFG